MIQPCSHAFASPAWHAKASLYSDYDELLDAITRGHVLSTSIVLSRLSTSRIVQLGSALGSDQASLHSLTLLSSPINEAAAMYDVRAPVGLCVCLGVCVWLWLWLWL